MTKLWKKRDGTLIKLSDMSQEHIESTMTILRRKSVAFPFMREPLLWLESFQNELDSRIIKHDEKQSQICTIS
jgi:hypothetical protein